MIRKIWIFFFDQNIYYFRLVELRRMRLKKKYPNTLDEIIQNEYEQLIVLYEISKWTIWDLSPYMLYANKSVLWKQ